MRNKILLMAIFYMAPVFAIRSFSLSYQPNINVVSVESYGAKGDGKTDDAAAFEKALMFCIKNNKKCYVPKTSNFYNIGSTIRVPLEPGESLNIVSNGAVIKPLAPPINNTAWNLTSFKEHIFLSIGKRITSIKGSEMFKNSDGSNIQISGLTFDGGAFSGPNAPTSLSTDIFIAIQALADVVSISDCSFKNIYGYGVTVYNVKNALLKRCVFTNVGGRGATQAIQKIDRDAFGDGIHYAMVKTNGMVNIQNCSFKGMRKDGKRSRSAITFEFSTQPYRIFLTNVNISGFAKCVHIEEIAPTEVHLDHVNMSDFNFGLANVLNDDSNVYLNKVQMLIGLSDGNDSGDALAFLNYRSKAKIYVDSSYLDFKGRKQAYQSATGLVEVRNSTINGNQTNFFFADGSTVFDHCNFIGFGGDGRSFSGGAASKYKIINSNLKKSAVIRASGQKLTLDIKNNDN